MSYRVKMFNDSCVFNPDDGAVLYEGRVFKLIPDDGEPVVMPLPDASDDKDVSAAIRDFAAKRGWGECVR